MQLGRLRRSPIRHDLVNENGGDGVQLVGGRVPLAGVLDLEIPENAFPLDHSTACPGTRCR